MIGLTHRQVQCLKFIREYQAKHQMSPSFTDISAGLGISRGNAHAVIARMKKRGAVTFNHRTARSIQIVEVSPQHRPLLGDHLSTLIEIYAFKQKIAPATAIREAVRSYVGDA